MEIVSALEQHVSAITALFNDYIAQTSARFETEPLTYANRLEWFRQFSPDSAHQLFVATEGESLLGFACSQAYRPGAAFLETVEVTIYLLPQAKGKGVGSALYQALFAALASQPVHCALAGIALPNAASIALHKKFGFEEVGVFHQYAKKNGEYLSSLWLQKAMWSHRQPLTASGEWF